MPEQEELQNFSSFTLGEKMGVIFERVRAMDNKLDSIAKDHGCRIVSLEKDNIVIKRDKAVVEGKTTMIAIFVSLVTAGVTCFINWFKN